MPHLVAVPDKLRGTASATQAAEAIAQGASEAGWSATALPLSDGGDGFLDALGHLGGRVHHVRVDGPLGRPVEARWLQLGTTAVVEMAQASGLSLVGGAAGNDPELASTAGTGQLILAARDTSPLRVVVGLGGSATTDGGWGAFEVVDAAGGMGDVELVGACDVATRFLDAARVFAPQKGATPGQVEMLDGRLRQLVERYRSERGVDVAGLPGSGAAGGLGGAIVALGGRLCRGFDVVADVVGLAPAMAAADLVVTAEGRVDRTSFVGKVVGEVVSRAAEAGLPCLVVAGEVEPGAASAGRPRDGGTAREPGALGGGKGDRGDRAPRVHLVSLVEQFGARRARIATTAAIAQAVYGFLRQ